MSDLNKRVEELEKAFDLIKEHIKQLNTAFNSENLSFVEHNIPREIQVVTAKIQEAPDKHSFTQNPPYKIPESQDFEKLKTLLNSPEWPSAIEQNLIVDKSSEQDKEDRAEGILDILINTNLQNLAFLDFGCGEGHVVKKAISQNARVAVGYDIEKFDKWQEFPDVNLTNDWENVVKAGPYDVINIYDVVDHMEPHVKSVEGLKNLRKVCHPSTKIYVRCHPFTSRHGTHLYQQLNKAFIQLVFSDDELEQLNLKSMPTRKTIHPIIHYPSLFAECGFKIVSPVRIQRETIERFFIDTPLVTQRIKKNWSGCPDGDLNGGRDFPMQLEQQFFDYVLQPD